MSQQILGTSPARNFYDLQAFAANHNDDDHDFGYASRFDFSPVPPCYTVPFHQPMDHYHAAIPSQVVAQTNGILPPAQRESDSGPQYPAQYPWQINSWDAAAFDVYRPGSFNPNAGLHDDLLNLPYGQFHPEPAFPIARTAPLWDLNGIHDFHQSDVSLADAAQLNTATFPTLVPAPPAQAPAPAAANRLGCPHGCPATFGRGGEYRRHMMIHERPRYRCPMVDCPRTFSRADKLRDHAKRGHGGRNPLNLS